MSKSFKDWYEDNRDQLAERRKQRYETDPAYREQVKQRSAEYRDRKRAESPKPEITGLTIQDVCTSLEISDWTLNSWRQQNYYPEPQKMLGRPVFTASQLQLLGMIKAFFTTYPRRLAGLHRQELGTIVDVVHHNWN